MSLWLGEAVNCNAFLQAISSLNLERLSARRITPIQDIFGNLQAYGP